MILLTHNAYWFQGEPSLWGDEQIRPHPLVVEALCRLYAELDADVICLQEVPGAAVVEELSAALQMTGSFAPGGRRPGYGGAVLWRDTGAAVTDLTHTLNPRGEVFERICMRLELAVPGQRRPIVNLHLASNRFAPDGGGEQVRLAELHAAFAAAPTPDVVTGDFNAMPSSAVYAQMVALGYVDARRDSDLHGRPAAERIDFIWVRSDSGLSVTDHGVVTHERFQIPGSPHKMLSDHHPVWARLELRSIT